MAECQRPIAHSGATPERNLSFRSAPVRNSPTRNHICRQDDTLKFLRRCNNGVAVCHLSCQHSRLVGLQADAKFGRMGLGLDRRR
jgi:hypothetical protein